MSVENVENHMANTCKCGSVNFALLKSGAIECNKCSDVMSEAKWLSAQPVEEHSLSLSYQIRRAIKAEDALHVAKQEIANLNGLLNASYVDPTGKSGLSALLKKAFWPSKLDKEILELVASQAIELEELGKEVTCIPDMREEIVYLKAQLAAAKQAQPEQHLFEFWWAEYMPDATQEQAFKAWAAAPSSKGVGIEQAQPERAPLSLEKIIEIVKAIDEKPGMSHIDVLVEMTRAIEAAHGIKQGGQHD